MSSLVHWKLPSLIRSALLEAHSSTHRSAIFVGILLFSVRKFPPKDPNAPTCEKSWLWMPTSALDAHQTIAHHLQLERLLESANSAQKG